MRIMMNFNTRFTVAVADETAQILGHNPIVSRILSFDAAFLFNIIPHAAVNLARLYCHNHGAASFDVNLEWSDIDGGNEDLMYFYQKDFIEPRRNYQGGFKRHDFIRETGNLQQGLEQVNYFDQDDWHFEQGAMWVVEAIIKPQQSALVRIFRANIIPRV